MHIVKLYKKLKFMKNIPLIAFTILVRLASAIKMNQDEKKSSKMGEDPGFPVITGLFLLGY